jgi:hypothetical protein
VGLSVKQNSLARFGNSSPPIGEARQIERQPNIALEPSRPLSCAIMSPRRTAQRVTLGSNFFYTSEEPAFALVTITNKGERQCDFAL